MLWPVGLFVWAMHGISNRRCAPARRPWNICGRRFTQRPAAYAAKALARRARRCKHRCCPFAMDQTNTSGATGTDEGRPWIAQRPGPGARTRPHIYSRACACSRRPRSSTVATTVRAWRHAIAAALPKPGQEGHHHRGSSERPTGRASCAGLPRVGGWRRTFRVVINAAPVLWSFLTRKDRMRTRVTPSGRGVGPCPAPSIYTRAKSPNVNPLGLRSFLPVPALRTVTEWL